ncbi:MAG: Na+/H+ antiporter subunit E [Desulfonatronovibrionaceae bacterium]
MTDNQSLKKHSSAPPFKIRGLIIQALLLMTLWLILSGHFDLEHILYGVLSVILVILLNLKIRNIPLSNNEYITQSTIKIPRLIIYLFWLVWQIIKSGVFVAYLTLHPRMPINPMVVRFKSDLPKSLAKVILGNSITLTPGTLTLDIQNDYFTVHALVDETSQDLVTGEMEARVGRLYLDHCTPEEMCTEVSFARSFHEAVAHIKGRKQK